MKSHKTNQPTCLQPRQQGYHPQTSTSSITTTLHHIYQPTMATRFRNLRLPIHSLRLYHSTSHPAPPGPFNAIETSILSASIPHIPSYGFTNTTLTLGAADAGYIAASANLFPSGAFSLVHYHLYTRRQALASHTHIIEATEDGGKPVGVGKKVKALTWERLLANKGVIHRWQEVRSRHYGSL